jgi:CRP/FNR family transcriptional regulator, anaerobic regulatory protein
MEQTIDVDKLIFKDPKLLEEIKRSARIRNYKKDDIFINMDDPISFIPVVLKGCIRVIRQDPKGNELFLYHLYPGQTCAMSLTCCQSGHKSMVKAVAEDDTELLQIPVNLIEQWFMYHEWRVFISSNYFSRFSELLDVIDLVAFNNMDKQLMHYLKERSKANRTKTLTITHQQIAEELHTHREAITRLLNTMEQKGLIKLGRNKIELLQ